MDIEVCKASTTTVAQKSTVKQWKKLARVRPARTPTTTSSSPRLRMRRSRGGLGSVGSRGEGLLNRERHPIDGAGMSGVRREGCCEGGGDAGALRGGIAAPNRTDPGIPSRLDLTIPACLGSARSAARCRSSAHIVRAVPAALCVPVCPARAKAVAHRAVGATPHPGFPRDLSSAVFFRARATVRERGQRECGPTTHLEEGSPEPAQVIGGG